MSSLFEHSGDAQTTESKFLPNKNMDQHIPSASQEVPKKQQRKQQFVKDIKKMIEKKKREVEALRQNIAQ